MAIDGEINFGVATINVNSRPIIMPINNQVLEFNAPSAKISLVVDDKETSSEKLTVNVNSGNPFLIPTENIIYETAGTNRTLSITPLKGEHGQTTITVIVSDGQLTAQTQFNITIKPPVISPLRIVQIQKLTNDLVQLVFSAGTNTEFRLEATSDFITWDHLSYLTMTNANIEILDVIDPLQTRRFYRLTRY